MGVGQTVAPVSSSFAIACKIIVTNIIMINTPTNYMNSKKRVIFTTDIMAGFLYECDKKSAFLYPSHIRFKRYPRDRQHSVTTAYAIFSNDSFA